MSILSVIHFPNELLRKNSKPIEEVTDEIRKLADDMLETMYANKGVGLAAIQVGITKRMMVMDISHNKKHPLVFINPEIISKEGSATGEEGCLSVPTIYAPVERATTLQVKALDRDGEAFELTATELLAVCIQHEMDHLNGKLFIDSLSPLKIQRIRKKLEKEMRHKK